MPFLYNRDIVDAAASQTSDGQTQASTPAAPAFQSSSAFSSQATTTQINSVPGDASTLPTMAGSSANSPSTSFSLTPVTKALIAVMAVTLFLTVLALCCWCLHKRSKRRQDDSVQAKARKLERHYEKAELPPGFGTKWVPMKELEATHLRQEMDPKAKRLTTGSMWQQMYGAESAGYWF